jgi:phage host-nuclease inhibitor protein Gam
MKTTKSKRIKATGLTNRLDFETTVDRIAYAQTELRALEAERDHAVLVAQATHALAIEDLYKEIEAKAALCEKFAEEHRAELLPGTAKSNETPLSRYGFRLGNPTLKTLSKWTWEKVIAALDRFQMNDCIRVKREVDKDAILCKGGDGAIDGYENAKKRAVALNEVGLRIVQAETFYIEPKVDGAEQVNGGAS